MPQFQIFKGEEEQFVESVHFSKIEDVIKTLEKSIHQYYFLDVIDQSAFYIKELIWDFKEWIMSEKTLYFVAQKNIMFSDDVKRLLAKNETVKKSWFEVNS